MIPGVYGLDVWPRIMGPGVQVHQEKPLPFVKLLPGFSLEHPPLYRVTKIESIVKPDGVTDDVCGARSRGNRWRL